MSLPRRTDAGARWLRCDLHVHTPFDGEKKFGENIRQAIDDFKRADTTLLAAIADRFVAACRAGAGGQGLDLVALTDHNSIEGYKKLAPFFASIAQRASEDGKSVPAILPGVEFSVGGERPLHFLVIFAANTDVDDIEGTIRHVFGAGQPFDPKRGTPLATGDSVGTFLDRLYQYATPATGERALKFVVLPAHADVDRGLGKETGANVLSVSTTLWDEMRGHLRERAVTRTDWNGFETSRAFAQLPQAFRDLLLRWAAAKRNQEWDQLDQKQKDAYRNQVHWPLVECSDPHSYQHVGSRFSWLKMELADVEGIRLALLDPESRLRRMSDGPPSRAYPRITRLRLRRTDFFEDTTIEFNPCLNTLIGGRGSGKSSVVEYVRYALDRARAEDLPDDEHGSVREAALSLLKEKKVRDFGESRGTLLPDHHISVDVVVADRAYRIDRLGTGISVTPDPDQPGSAVADLDVRSLVVPRVLSQRQIARIARDPASQRTELDALIDVEQIRRFGDSQSRLGARIQELQQERTRLAEQGRRLPGLTTELRTITDQIAFLESGDRQAVVKAFTDVETERVWLDDIEASAQDFAAAIDALAAEQDEALLQLPERPVSTPNEALLTALGSNLSQAQTAAIRGLRERAIALRAGLEAARLSRTQQWQPGFEKARAAYDALRQDLKARGIDFSQHEKLVQRKTALEREIAALRKSEGALETTARQVRETRGELVVLHEQRHQLRRTAAHGLEEADADVRLEVLGFLDRSDFEQQRTAWFGDSGLRENDWDALCGYVFQKETGIPERIQSLVDALRADVEATTAAGTAIGNDKSNVGALPQMPSLSGHFFRCLEKGDRIRLDDTERFLPNDLVEAKVRSADGVFKPITSGSVGQRSTAVLSLLLSAGDQPLIIDQPEDDLDNQYVYNVVVSLLRKRKFSRQIIIATHNANIPVNGDAELIVGLGVAERLGTVMCAGSIDSSEVKEQVSVVMEGSVEAFRLRGERYGY